MFIILHMRPRKLTKYTAQKMKFFMKDFFSKWINTQLLADLVTFIEKSLMKNFTFVQ